MPPIARCRRAIPLALIAPALLGAPATALDLSRITAGTWPGFVINGDSAYDNAGVSVSAAGDVNGDGLGDLIVGADRSSYSGPDSGRVYVVFGKSSPGAVDLSAIGGTLGFAINAPNGGDRLGISVSAAGDVNGDGLGDLIVGGHLTEYGSYPGGAAYVVWGKTSGTAVDVGALGAGGFRIRPETWHDQMGFSVSGAGDVNGDGLADVIVSAHTHDIDFATDAGRSYVVFGKTSTADVMGSAIAAGAGGFAIDGEAFDDFSGRSVSGAGDVNGDGLADVIVGAFAADANGSDSGKAHVVFGKTSGTAVKLSAIAAGAGGGFAMLGESAYDYAGRAVSSAGDVNADGLCDVIVGAIRADPNSLANSGRSYVVFGRTAATPLQLSAVAVGVGGFVINGQASQDLSGTGVSSAGDMNGNGAADLLVGAPLFDYPFTEAGRGYVVFGKSTTAAINLSAIADTLIGAGLGGYPLTGAVANDRTASALSAAGDVNGDGLDDVIVGALLADAPGPESGRAYVVFSTATPPSSAIYRTAIPAGDQPRWGVGTHRFGVDRSVFPSSRCWVDFSVGSALSQTTVNLTRSDTGLAGGFTPEVLANAFWAISASRPGGTACRVTVRYTDAEIAGLTEGSLVMYHGLSTSGPWAVAGSFSLDAARNEASGNLPNLPRVVVLATSPPDNTAPVPIITRLLSNPTANQNPTWSIEFSESVTGTVAASEITPTGTLAAAVDNIKVDGTSPPFTVRLYSNTETANATLGFTLATGAVTDLVGNNSSSASAPGYTVNEVAAGFTGDVNKDGSVNAADVTALADHIVNGTPLP